MSEGFVKLRQGQCSPVGSGAITYNVSGVYVVKMGTSHFLWNTDFLSLKPKGRGVLKNILTFICIYRIYGIYLHHNYNAMTRLQQFDQEVKEITKNSIRNSMPEPKMLAVEFCGDLPNSSYSFAWSVSSCASGLQKDYIKSLGLVVCKREEATAQIIIGERPEGSPYVGFWKARANKSYWLKHI